MKLRTGDAVVIAAVLVTAAFLLFCPRLFAEKRERLLAEITVDGETAAVLPLDQDAVFDCRNGVVVTVSGGAVSVSESDCPDRLCVRRGPVSDRGAVIVCLPNRTVVRIVSDAESEVDGVV